MDKKELIEKLKRVALQTKQLGRGDKEKEAKKRGRKLTRSLGAVGKKKETRNPKAARMLLIAIKTKNKGKFVIILGSLDPLAATAYDSPATQFVEI